MTDRGQDGAFGGYGYPNNRKLCPTVRATQRFDHDEAASVDTDQFQPATLSEALIPSMSAYRGIAPSDSDTLFFPFLFRLVSQVLDAGLAAGE